MRCEATTRAVCYNPPYDISSLLFLFSLLQTFLRRVAVLSFPLWIRNRSLNGTACKLLRCYRLRYLAGAQVHYVAALTSKGACVLLGSSFQINPHLRTSCEGGYWVPRHPRGDRLRLER
ncbi:hypothetical protein BaRGS_00008227 [Batillaria attramentaria]|uniref:Uncharacterized protein n=1 Tax=Batillaria attramentaria TaxID=370345 RepID=A0ABD0LNM4_9CAEN